MEGGILAFCTNFEKGQRKSTRTITTQESSIVIFLFNHKYGSFTPVQRFSWAIFTPLTIVLWYFQEPSFMWNISLLLYNKKGWKKTFVYPVISIYNPQVTKRWASNSVSSKSLPWYHHTSQKMFVKFFLKNLFEKVINKTWMMSIKRYLWHCWLHYCVCI